MARTEFSQAVNVTSQFSEKIAYTEANSAAALPASTGYEVLYIYAPSKNIAELQNVYFTYPAVAAATSGGKIAVLSLVNGANIVDLVTVNGNYNVATGLNNMCPNGQTSFTPNDLAAFVNVIKNVRFDDTTAFAVRWYNQTNGATAETRTLKLIMKNTAVN